MLTKSLTLVAIAALLTTSLAAPAYDGGASANNHEMNKRQGDDWRGRDNWNEHDNDHCDRYYGDNWDHYKDRFGCKDFDHSRYNRGNNWYQHQDKGGGRRNRWDEDRCEEYFCRHKNKYWSKNNDWCKRYQHNDHGHGDNKNDHGGKGH